MGSKKPNDLGLFDLHGNVSCWCQEIYQEYPQGKGEANEDKEGIYSIVATTPRVLRGSSFSNRAVIVRPANRTKLGPGDRNISAGFRPARTSR